VIAKRTSTSILASIGVWMFFSIVLGILANAVAGILIPLPAEGFTGGQGKFERSDEFLEAMSQRTELTNSIMNLSPTELFENSVSDILGVRTGFQRMSQEFTRVMSLGEALSANWASVSFLAVGLVICFAASYMMFLRMEIRPGD
jgi:ABC-2 type transport system permease protein